MGAVVGIVFFVVVYALIKAAASGAGPVGLTRRGQPARGILLKVAPTATRVPGTIRNPYETRGVVIDVEVPGQPPFETPASLFVPKNLARDVLPGVTVELRVDRKNRQRMVVVGLGAGFPVILPGAQSPWGSGGAPPAPPPS